MQDREPSTLEHSWSEDVAAGALPRQPASLWDALRRDVLRRDRDDVLLVRTPYDGRALTGLLAAMALAASFALGWTGALNWPDVETMLGLGHVAQKEAPSPHVAEAKPAGRPEGVRKSASTPDLRTVAPATVGSISKPSAASGRASAEPSNPVLGQCRSGRGGDGGEARVGAAAGDEADNHSRLERRRGSGRNRRARGPRRNPDGRARRHDSRGRAN